MFGFRRPGTLTLAATTVLLAIAGWSPLGPIALQALEDRHPSPAIAEPVAGIILLGGAVNTHISVERGATHTQ